MKSLLKISAIALGLLLFAGTSQKAMAQYDDVSLQTFYDELSPYGTWIKDPEYGYVWRPDVDQNEFRPYYSNGRWAMTEYGNTWVSNYEWGWAPFHYGRWIHNRYNNWVWIPGTVWGPAWVSWRSGGGYYGWAPLGPSINININIGRRYVTPEYYWNFIPARNIYYNNYPRYYSGRNRVYIQNTVIINNTYVRNNHTYYTGPRAEDVRRATNQDVKVYNVARTTNRNDSRVEGGVVNVYTPRPTRGNANTNAAPREVVQGSISRGRIESNVISSESSRVSRGSNSTVIEPKGERYQSQNADDRNIVGPTRDASPNQSRGERSANNENAVFGRSREAATPERNNGNVTQSRQQPQQEVNRPYTPITQSSSEGRSNAPQAQPQQRSVEHSAPQRPERVERGTSSSSRSGESTSSQSSRGQGSGRPGRG